MLPKKYISPSSYCAAASPASALILNLEIFSRFIWVFCNDWNMSMSVLKLTDARRLIRYLDGSSQVWASISMSL